MSTAQPAFPRNVDDGDPWAPWVAAYREAFVAHALSRPGWDRENAEAWAEACANDAVVSCFGTAAADEVARQDVLECERTSLED